MDRTCLAESSPGTPCARPVDFPTTDPPPWPMCTGHALAAYRYVGQLVTDAVDVIAASPAIADLHATATTVPPVGVYYLRVGNLVKIGWSGDVRARLRSYPPHSTLLAVEPGPAKLERDRLGQFSHLRAARREWHHPGPDLLAHIDSLQDAA